MKKSYSLGAALFVCLLLSFDAITNSGGSPAGRSGSPASNNATCATGGCHGGGPAVSTQIATITSNIPATGFLENTDYTITVTLDAGATGSSKIGFMASVENGGAQGTLSTGGNSDVRIVSSNYVTHTSSGTSTSNNTKVYTFDWNSGSAPDQTTVYVSANFSNSNGGTSGDVILTSSLALSKDVTIGTPEAGELQVSVYPNPSTSAFYIEHASAEINTLYLLDFAGRTVKVFDASANFDGTKWTLNTEGVPAGTYLIKANDASFKTQQVTLL